MQGSVTQQQPGSMLADIWVFLCWRKKSPPTAQLAVPLTGSVGEQSWLPRNGCSGDPRETLQFPFFRQLLLSLFF